MNKPYPVLMSVVEITAPYLPNEPEGFTLPTSFPEDCPLHQAARNAAEQFYREIPGNTAESLEIIKNPHFNIEQYKHEKVVADFLLRIAYAEHHINAYINTGDWFGEITDYVHYLIESLGKPYFSLDQLLVTIICHYIESDLKPNHPSKAQDLLNYFQTKPEDELANQVDLDELQKIYDKWLNTFPFNFSSLKYLEGKFNKTFPVLAENGINRYTNQPWVRFKTRKQLLEWLRAITERTLGAVNIEAMVDSWGINEKKAHQLSLIFEKHRVAQYRNLNRFTKGENKYYQVIEGWLKEEQETISLLIEYSQAEQIGSLCTEQTISESENLLNDMSLDLVRKWFMQLATRNSSNGKPFLDVNKVEAFIRRAFLKDATLPKLSLNIAASENMSVRKLFYQYYQACTNDYAIEPTKHCKDKYVRLLTDNFTNFKYKTVFNTFNNARTAPIDWTITV